MGPETYRTFQLSIVKPDYIYYDALSYMTEKYW